MVASAGHEGRGLGFDTQRVQNTKIEVLCIWTLVDHCTGQARRYEGQRNEGFGFIRYGNETQDNC